MDSKYEIKYNNLIQGLEEMHAKNVKRTKAALRCLLIIPAVILIMLFMTKGSKTIFLVLWIASMFIIAFVLIVVEYQDYLLRKMVAKAQGATADAEASAAIAAPAGNETPLPQPSAQARYARRFSSAHRSRTRAVSGTITMMKVPVTTDSHPNETNSQRKEL